MDSGIVKCHHRTALAQEGLGRLQEALSAGMAGLAREPEDATLQALVQRLKTQLTAQRSAAELALEDGNTLFKRGKVQEAIAKYTEVLGLATTDDLRVRAYNNRAVCYSQIYEHQKVIADTSAVLALDSMNTKALLRRAATYESQGSLREAYADFKAVHSHDPVVEKAAVTKAYLESVRGDAARRGGSQAHGVGALTRSAARDAPRSSTGSPSAATPLRTSPSHEHGRPPRAATSSSGPA